MSFLGCLFGTLIGNALYDVAFNKHIDKKVEDNFEKRWFE